MPRDRSGGGAIRAFLHSEIAGGSLLIAAAALAIVLANSPAAPLYARALAARIGPLDLRHWIDDVAMSGFFLLVGLEIKRELVCGHLARAADRVLPVIAAIAGMAVPALVYLAMVRGDPALARGWAIPAATDIAFALAVLALLGRRVPASLRLFLTTVAIVDDMGAVAIIAVAYTAELHLPALAAALGAMLLMALANRRGVTALPVYLALAALLWLAVHASGIHATVAGVLAAAFVPVRGRDAAAEAPPLHRLERALHPWIAFGVVPLFGFANAGVDLRGAGVAGAAVPLPLAIAAGLFLGKQAGIFAAVRGAAALGIAPRPAGASWPQVYGAALLCGVGFTMSLFIGGLAFPGDALAAEVKLGVLGGSLLSAAAGYAVLRLAGPRRG